MEAKHTPGDWELVVQHGKRFIVTNPRSNPFVGHVIACETTAPESVANLTLMAVAPKMLGLVERFAFIAERMPAPTLGEWNWPELAADAREAIAKAKGE